MKTNNRYLTRFLRLSIKTWLFIAASSGILFAVNSAYAEDFTATNKDEAPIAVDICEVLENPADFDHKLIQLSGHISQGFEQFTISKVGCVQTKSQGIWLEYGGKVGSGTTYCCGRTNAKTRTETMSIEGVEIPLVQDEKWQEFDKIIKNHKGYASFDATIVGRFFSGKETKFPTGTYWTGFGHFGFFSLLAIQKVFSIDSNMDDN